MARTVITNEGLELLNAVPAEGTPTYWLGYYGLAFVPSDDRMEGKSDELRADMTALTRTGDHIYNLWQGSMVASGYAQGTSAAELGGISMYTSNLMSRFRYVLDDEGNNNLVMFRGTSDSNLTDIAGACVYRGRRTPVPGEVENDSVMDVMPLPAPLFYTDSDGKYSAPPTKESFTGEDMERDYFNDYPKYEGLPAVTTDTRGYAGASPELTDSTTFDYAVTGVNDRLWVSSIHTYNQDGVNGDSSKSLEPDYNRICKQFWKFRSISNYNRYHAPASSEGFLVDYEPACRNMSKVTRLFPIGHYKVVNAKEGASTETAGRTIATTLRYSIELSLDDVYNTTATRALTQSGECGIKSIGGEDLYQTKECSIKFNRIGLYAVPMTVHRFYDHVNDANSRKACRDFRVQFEVDGNAEPVLFAVVDLDTTVFLREGSGETSTYKVNIDLNLGEGDGGSLIRDAAVFYNMYEDSAITWYENQLIATASQAEAVTALGLDMGVMKQRMDRVVYGDGGCTTEGSMTDMFALKNHSHNYMRNLADGLVNPGAVRGITSTLEGDSVTFRHFDSFVSGQNTIITVSSVDEDADKKIFYVVHGTKRN